MVCFYNGVPSNGRKKFFSTLQWRRIGCGRRYAIHYYDITYYVWQKLFTKSERINHDDAKSYVQQKILKIKSIIQYTSPRYDPYFDNVGFSPNQFIHYLKHYNDLTSYVWKNLFNRYNGVKSYA